MRGVAHALGEFVRPTGRVWLAALALAFAAGYGAGWLEALVIAWAGLAATVLALAMLLRPVPHRVTIDMPHTRVSVGQDATATVVHSNGSARRRGPITVEVPLGGAERRVVVPAVRPGRTARVAVPVDTRRRAVIAIGPARTVRADPLGLFRRQAVWSGSAVLRIHPRILLIPSTSSGYVRDLEGSVTRDLTASDMAFHALREYVPGDHPRTIHWKSSARSQRLMVRQFEQTRRSHVVILLVGGADAYANDDEYELAVSVCGSLGVRAIRDGRTTTVITSQAHRPRPHALAAHTPRGLLDDLAGVATVAGSVDLARAAAFAHRRAPDASFAFLVGGSLLTAEAVRHAASVLGATGEVLGVTCRPGEPVSYRFHEALSVLSVGALDDLGPALVRTAA